MWELNTKPFQHRDGAEITFFNNPRLICYQNTAMLCRARSAKGETLPLRGTKHKERIEYGKVTIYKGEEHRTLLVRIGTSFLALYIHNTLYVKYLASVKSSQL